MSLSRAVLMAELNRYLQEHPKKQEMLRELERRLPVDGRPKPTHAVRAAVKAAVEDGKFADDERLLWWCPQNEEPIHIHDLRNGHLTNIIQMLYRGYKARQAEKLRSDTLGAATTLGSALSEAWAAHHPQLPILIREARWRGLEIPELNPTCQRCGHPAHPPGEETCAYAPGGTPCDCPGEPECRWCERGHPRIPSSVKPGGFVHNIPEVGREVCLRTEK